MKPYRTSSFLVFLLLLTLPLSSVARPKKAVQWVEQSVVLRPPVLTQPLKNKVRAVTLGEWLNKKVSFPQDYSDTVACEARVAYAVDRAGKLTCSILPDKAPAGLIAPLQRLLEGLPPKLVPAIDADSYVDFADTLRVVWDYPQCYVPGEGRNVPQPFYMETPEGRVKMLARPVLKTKEIPSLTSWLGRHVVLPGGTPDGSTWVAYTVTDEGEVKDVEVDPALSQEARNVLLHAMDSLPRLTPARTWMREPVTFRDSLPLSLRRGKLFRYREDNEPFIVTERMPSYDGGDLQVFRRWVMERIRYPVASARKGIQGNVIVSFVIERNGTLGTIRVLSTPDIALSDEVIRVLSRSERWSPGVQRGEAVRVRYTLPVQFKINYKSAYPRTKLLPNGRPENSWGGSF